jgi:putative transposase
MPNYRRLYCGPKWFFTLVTENRVPILTDETTRSCLRQAITECRNRYPFLIDCWVLLPDHLHCIWSIEEPDTDFSIRWALIKRLFTKQFKEQTRRPGPFWQRGFWEHWIRHEIDYENHMNYVHYNPVKHGYVDNVRDWQWSSFHRHVAQATYPVEWGSGVIIADSVGSE